MRVVFRSLLALSRARSISTSVGSRRTTPIVFPFASTSSIGPSLLRILSATFPQRIPWSYSPPQDYRILFQNSANCYSIKQSTGRPKSRRTFRVVAWLKVNRILTHVSRLDTDHAGPLVIAKINMRALLSIQGFQTMVERELRFLDRDLSSPIRVVQHAGIVGVEVDAIAFTLKPDR